MIKHDFTDFGLITPIRRALTDMDYTVPTPVQLQAIPPLLKGRDLLGCAQTGTGKTAAFALPIIQHLVKNPKKRERGFVRALIVTPTRELAAQIHENLVTFSRYADVRSTVIYGGVGQNPQVKDLNRGVDILVATPGRLLDLIGQGYIKLEKVEIFVLDEADRMLDMGFVPDVRRILEHIPDERQTMFLSATMPPKIVNLARNMVNDPVKVDVTPEKPVVELIDQQLMKVEVRKKPDVLMNILKMEEVGRALVFTRTKHGANKLVKILLRASIGAQGIHGNKSQSARKKALDDFKAGRTRVLVATDLAARGIDVEGISHVFNYDIPNISETYIHRIGRTARAGCRGISISLCSPQEAEHIRDIEKLIRQPIPVVDPQPYMGHVELKPGPLPAKRQPRASPGNGQGRKPRNPAPKKDRQYNSRGRQGPTSEGRDHKQSQQPRGSQGQGASPNPNGRNRRKNGSWGGHSGRRR